eukprot:m.202174 g.202174  ORF g.202174 m.202174 type:complete len:480 (+) comp13720_c0_seq1:73-1512(+)
MHNVLLRSIVTTVRRSPLLCCSCQFHALKRSKCKSLSHPKFVPFQVTEEHAKENMEKWVPIFAPKSVKEAVAKQIPTKAFLPFWVFEVVVHSKFRGQIAKEDSTVSFDSLKSTYKVRNDTNWIDTHGWLDAGDREYAATNPQMQVFAGCSFRRENVQALKGDFVEDALTFDTTSSEHLKQINDSLIYPLEADTTFAWTLIKSRLNEMESVIGERLMKDYFDASAVRKMRLKTSTLSKHSQLVYLPVYIYSYEVGKHSYRAFVSGVTGEIGGQKISSGMQLGSVVGIGAGALTAMVFPEPMTVLSVASIAGGLVGGLLAKLPQYKQKVFDKNQTRELERQMEIRDVNIDLGLADEHLRKEELFQSRREKEFSPNKIVVAQEDLADPEGHYKRLGLDHICQNASLGEIKDAFRGRVVQSVMKSRLDPSFSNEFSQLCDSYGVLRNEKRRKLYDDKAVDTKRHQNEAREKLAGEEKEKQDGG